MSDATDDLHDELNGEERMRAELAELEGRAAMLRAALGEPPLVPAGGDEASRDHDAPPLLLVHLDDDPADHPGHRAGCARLGRGGGVAHCTCGVIWTATERRGGVRVGDVTRGGLTVCPATDRAQGQLAELERTIRAGVDAVIKVDSSILPGDDTSYPALVTWLSGRVTAKKEDAAYWERLYQQQTTAKHGMRRNRDALQQELGALRVLVSGLFHGVAAHVNQTAPQGLDAAGQLQWALLRVREMAERWSADQLTYEQTRSGRDAWRAAYEESSRERDDLRRRLDYVTRRLTDLAMRVKELTSPIGDPDGSGDDRS